MSHAPKYGGSPRNAPAHAPTEPSGRYNTHVSVPRLHLFVCTNHRPIGGRPACGADELVSALTAGIAARQALRGQARVTACECLGPCFDGPNLIVYPEGVWYGGVRSTDVDAILDDHLIGGQPVARLVLDLAELD